MLSGFVVIQCQSFPLTSVFPLGALWIRPGRLPTVLLLSSSISGAIQPSVPAAPDRRENDIRPAASFLHRPKSEIMARTSPRESGWDINTLWGLMSRWTGYRLTNERIRLCLHVPRKAMSYAHRHKTLFCSTNKPLLKTVDIVVFLLCQLTSLQIFVTQI